MPLSTLADAPAFDRNGFTFRPLAVPSRGSSELALWTVVIAPGLASEAHSMDREEVFVVVAGKISGTIGGEEFDAIAGDAVIVPAHTLLQLRNSCLDSHATITAVNATAAHLNNLPVRTSIRDRKHLTSNARATNVVPSTAANVHPAISSAAQIGPHLSSRHARTAVGANISTLTNAVTQNQRQA